MLMFRVVGVVDVSCCWRLVSVVLLMFRVVCVVDLSCGLCC